MASSNTATMTTVAAQMSMTLRERLQRIAERDDRKLSYVIRKACEEYAERHENGQLGDEANGETA